MDVLDEVESTRPAHLLGMKVRSPSGDTAQGEFAASHGFRGFRDRGLAVRRLVLDEIVLRGAERAGARVEEGLKVTDLERDSTARVVGVRALGDQGSPRTLRSRYVVGADGLRSVVGRRLDLVRTSRVYPRRIALVAHYRGIEGVTEYGEM